MTNLHINKQYYDNIDWTADKVKEELNAGLSILNKYANRMVTFFGSHRIDENHEYYQHCKDVAKKLGDLDIAIISGGGPGIMHAANTGATESKVPSIGLKAELLTGEKVLDPIFTDEHFFHFLFVRRFLMAIKSDALIFYPGGYGTLNELFEYLVLIQVGIADKVPVICVNKKYWEGLFEWLKASPMDEKLFIQNSDIDLISLVDDVEEIIEIVK